MIETIIFIILIVIYATGLFIGEHKRQKHSAKGGGGHGSQKGS